MRAFRESEMLDVTLPQGRERGYSVAGRTFDVSELKMMIDAIQYYLANRPFTAGDVKLMVDAIESSKYLSEAKTLKLIEALQRLCPETQVKDMKSQLVVFDRVKSMNTDIHESLGVISSAIAHNQQIQFKYFDYDMNKKRAYRKKGEVYQMSPYELVYTDDNYYLVAYDAVKKKRTTFRVDRMANVAIVLMDREGQEAFGDNRKEKLRLQKSTLR